jgi:hypothetical protein
MSIGDGLPVEKLCTFRFGKPTRLSGDIIDNQLTFRDMTHHTLVKNNSFNGMIYLYADNILEMCKEYSYENFKARL